MSRRNLLFVHSSDPHDHLGGGETSLISLVENLDRARFRPLVAISGAGEFQRRLHDVGVETRVVAMDPLYYKLAETRPTQRALRAGRALPAIYQLARVIDKERVDLVCTNVQAAHLYGALAAKLTRRPLIMYVRDIPHGQFSSRLFPWWAARFADRIVAISTAVRDFYSQAPDHGARCARKISVVHNGIDLKRFAPMAPCPAIIEEFELRGRAPVITLIGRLQPLKGQRELILATPRILASHAGARVLLVGDSFAYEREFADELRRLARARGVESAVVFAGQRADVPELLSVTDVLVSASSHEAFGRTLVEAMAMEKPVVGTRSGGPSDIIVENDTGYLVAPKDPDALADAVLRLWSDPERARAMGRRGRERALAHFDVHAMVRSASAVFDQVLG